MGDSRSQPKPAEPRRDPPVCVHCDNDLSCGACGMEQPYDDISLLKAELAEWKQAASVEADLRREFLARAEQAERRVEELEKECRILREVMMTPSEPDAVRLHREKCDALDRVFALQEALREVVRIGQWTGTDGLTYTSAEARASRATLSKQEPGA